MKQIKISNKLHKELETLKEEKETYGNIVSRILKENKELKQDKEFLKQVMKNITEKQEKD